MNADNPDENHSEASNNVCDTVQFKPTETETFQPHAGPETLVALDKQHGQSLLDDHCPHHEEQSTIGCCTTDDIDDDLFTDEEETVECWKGEFPSPGEYEVESLQLSDNRCDAITGNSMCGEIADAQSTHVSHSNEFPDVKIKSSLLCWSCKKVEAKYKCPKCLTKTCSVTCVKFHKKTLNCDGIRCKSTYVPKENLRESHLVNDYRFLEEVNRCACRNSRNKLPYHRANSMKLKINKASSMNIRLRIMPPNFKRRKENSTYYCFKNKGFLWHVEWIFSSCNIVIPSKRFPDNIPLIKGIEKFITPKAGNTNYYPRLHEFCDKTDLNFYMKKEETPANKTTFFKLDRSEGVRTNLCGKTVIEFPRIHVVLSQKSSEYENSLVDK